MNARYMKHNMEETVDIITDSICCGVDSTFNAQYLDFNITVSVKNDLEKILFVAITEDTCFASTFRVTFNNFKHMLAEKPHFLVQVELVDYILDSMELTNDYLYYEHRYNKPEKC